MINEYVPIRKIARLLDDLHFPKGLCAKIYDIYHKRINHKLNKLFYLSEKYVNNSEVYPQCNVNKNKNIWVFWWQGLNNMPRIVNRCIRSVYLHSSDYHIIFITKKNVKQYAKLPKYIYYKLSKKEITLTHFSDILRFNLLYQYGGLWIDATVFCISNIPKNINKRSLYTTDSGYIKDHGDISLGKWTGFFFGGKAHQPLFMFMNYFFKLYWSNNNNLIDYFLVDYALNYAYVHNIGDFKNYIDNYVICRPNVLKMIDLLNHKYNKKIFKTLSNNTFFFKLTYKINLKKQKNTFYNELVNN